MSATTYHRYQATHEERFRRLLAAWLATLPPDGWTGGVAELFTELNEFEHAGNFLAFVPTRLVSHCGLGVRRRLGS